MPERSEEPIDVRCQWCAAVGRPNATQCHECAAALPLLETVGELVVPGVTHVDPELEAYAAQPLRPLRRSATETLAPGVMAAAALGGPAAVVGMGALAAVAASELAGGNRGKGVPADKLGEVSEPVLEVARRLQRDRAERGPQIGPPDAPTEPSRQQEGPLDR
jgi:hypothetical protein